MVWIDFEDVCLGPSEWDLATMMDEDAVARASGPKTTQEDICRNLYVLFVGKLVLSNSRATGRSHDHDATRRSQAHRPEKSGAHASTFRKNSNQFRLEDHAFRLLGVGRSR
jgi:hypothetical protein